MPATTPELQYTILANGLINHQSKRDNQYKTNQFIEFYNDNLKKLFKAKHGSAITLDYLFEYCSLNTEFFDFIAKRVESFYGIGNNGKHAIKLACRDITVMAECLACNSITLHPKKITRFEVVDVFTLGLL